MSDLPVIQPAAAIAVCGKCKATLYKGSRCDNNDPQCPLLTADFANLVANADSAATAALAEKA